MHIRMLAIALVAALSFVLTGCSGDGGTPEGDVKALAQRLANAKATLDSAETIAVDLSTESLPSGVTGLLSASGKGNHSPAFTGTVKVVLGGATADAEITSVDGVVYAKIGFLPMAEIDPTDYQAPDPATLIATSGGISDLLIKTTDLKAGDRSRDGDAVLSTIEGSLPGSVVKTLLPSADASESFSVTYRLDDEDELRDAKISGPFYPDGGTTTYTVRVTTSDTPVTITKP